MSSADSQQAIFPGPGWYHQPGADFLTMRSAEGDLGRWPQLARELGALKPRVIVLSGYAWGGFLQYIPGIPIGLTGIAADPIAVGLAESFVHPGGMSTGNVMNAVGGEETMTQKRIGLFKHLVPSLTRLGMIAPAGVVAKKEKFDGFYTF